ncbi:unnamed protein product, partial [Ectocarpus sp. 8 AP-2014]
MRPRTGRDGGGTPPRRAPRHVPHRLHPDGHDGRDQRSAREAGRAVRLGHHQGFPRFALHRESVPPQHLRPRDPAAGAAVQGRRRGRREGHPGQERRGGVGARTRQQRQERRRSGGGAGRDRGGREGRQGARPGGRAWQPPGRAGPGHHQPCRRVSAQ